MEYRVLTLWEPWATLVVHGIKKIETRPKPTSWTVEKGTYLIHAAKKWSKEQEKVCLNDPFLEPFKGCFNFGHIIGSVEVKECKKIPLLVAESDREIYVCLYENFYVSWKEFDYGDYDPGRYAWLLQNPRILETPIPYKGQQGFYPRFKGDFDKLKFVE